MMKYKVQFSKGWRGTWKFDALNDKMAWEIARDFINGHTQTIIVAIAEIWELDDSGNTIRKLKDYEEHFIPYKVHFENGDCILKIYEGKDDFLVWNEARRTIEKIYNSKVNRIEELGKLTGEHIRQLDSYAKCKKNHIKKETKKGQKQIEQAIYNAYFSDGECSGPYISKVSENDVVALEMAEYKLKQHIEYNRLDIVKIKVTQVEELNENMLFDVNVERKQKEKEERKKGKEIKEKKNRCLM